MISEVLSEEESYLFALLSDPSGLDQAECLWEDPEAEFGIWRAWSFQWKWFRDISPLQIDQSGRAIGKSISIKLRAFAFPFLHPGQEMVVTAPELVHLNPIIGLIERQILDTRLSREMLPRKANHGITHRPFEMTFMNGARIFGRIPQKDGKGIKGCVTMGALILTERGILPVEDLRVGDLVWTHNARWRPVTEIQHFFEEDVWEVDGQGAPTQFVSHNHCFYARRNIATNPAKQKRRLGPPVWVRPEDMDYHYWASPSEFKGEMPVPPLDYSNNNSRMLQMDDDFWWLVGRFLADGYTGFEKKNGRSVRGRINIIVVPGHDQVDIIDKFRHLQMPTNITQRDHSSANRVSACSGPWANWLDEHFGKLAGGKRLPVFVLFLPEHLRRALFEGYLSGDGTKTEVRPRCTVGSASKPLIIGMKLLAQSLGYNANYTVVQPTVTEIRGLKLKKEPQLSHRLQITWTGHPIEEYGFRWARIHSAKPSFGREVFNPVVQEDHSYVADSVISHNTHPLWLEMDESQNYPDAGWVEIIETLKRGHDGAVWRAHGVTRGVRDYFYKFTQPHSGWMVHRITALHRPTWSDQERSEKIQQYGSRDHPDYRRNILGLHGDASNALFVLHQLMKCVDDNVSSDYNQFEYQHIRITGEMINDNDGNVEMLLDLPRHHLQPGHRQFWCGMDVGVTNHPSEILVFADVQKPKGGFVLKLITRVHLERVRHGDQVAVIEKLFSFYNPAAFSLDKTGIGLMLFQPLQDRNPGMAEKIKGYNFSGKILVGIDKTVEIDEYRGDLIKDAGIEVNVLQYASDKLRDYVDNEQVLLPWDTELLGEMQGQTYVILRDTMNQYGKKSYSKGTFHALDAMKMAVLGKVQTPIEAMTKVEKFEPITPIFFVD